MNYRDPIHGIINLTLVEKEIIDTPLFQRLRHIKQLTCVDLVFTGGNHTRFSHSIGVCHLAGIYAKHLGFDPKYTQIVRLAALLHDIGHGPFSHTFDRIVYYKFYNDNSEKFHGHDRHRFFLLSFFKSILAKYDLNPDDIEDIWSGRDIIGDAITHGPVGADRMDFILRDSYFTGTQHFGTIAADRIISNSLIKNGMLVYKSKIIQDICQALFARFYMYENVYLHKTVCAADVLVRKILEEYVKTINIDDVLTNVDKFLTLTDEILYHVMLSNDPKLSKCKEWCQLFLHRKLPKLVQEFSMSPKEFEECNFSVMLHKNHVLHETREIHVMLPSDFDKYQIKFWNGNELLSFKDVIKHHRAFQAIVEEIESKAKHVLVRIFNVDTNVYKI